MNLVEILTAISLFCPQERTEIFHNYPGTVVVENECREKAWKCIDKARKAHAKEEVCRSGLCFHDQEEQARLERCFR